MRATLKSSSFWHLKKITKKYKWATTAVSKSKWATIAVSKSKANANRVHFVSELHDRILTGNKNTLHCFSSCTISTIHVNRSINNHQHGQ